uniref:ATP-dependent Clp protease proteolytic subunit n=1 Tax=Phelipanche purpurea TaxID=223125 RepID=V6AQB2_PHEPU|nr:clp protease proteolytic subunit [Phelipanche purpurea]CDH98337.1 clp protease proteolytic subunit [Phelipanche purpurea]
MLYLAITMRTKDQQLFINCSGGLTMYALAIYNTMQSIKPNSDTIGLGVAASMGSMILAGGAIEKRIALPHLRVMIRQPRWDYSGKIRTSDCVRQAEEAYEIRKMIIDIYAKSTKKPSQILERDMDREYFMSAAEAKEYGIVDHVLTDPTFE